MVTQDDAEVTAAAERAANDPPLDPWKVLEAMHMRSMVEGMVADLTAERDRARDIAEALEGQVAAVRAEVAHWRREWIPSASAWVETCADAIDAALDPDPADRGTGRDGGAS